MPITARRILLLIISLGPLGALWGLWATTTAQAAAPIQIIVQTADKRVDIRDVATILGGTVLDSTPDNTHLLSVSSLPRTLPPGVTSITLNDIYTLPRFKGIGLEAKTAPVAPLPWYSAQPTMQLVHSRAALKGATGRGVVIAVIDSTIDVSHPALRGHLTTGHDFLNGKSHLIPKSNKAIPNQSTASFLDQSTAAILDAFLNQSTASFLDQATLSFLQQSTASFLDQSTASFLESASPGHGHATMVAGILVALAPDALIMPLRTFDDSGTGDAYQIAKAIRYAVQNGAQVINLSLGLSQYSASVKSAVDFAVKRNVVVVCSAGNSNSGVPQWPAAVPGVVGVAATDLNDVKATFSNYGPWVFVSAPGLNVITAYPNGYAVASGTSFSAPFVAAEAALIRSLTTQNTEAIIARSSVNINRQNPSYAGQLGNGRVDLSTAVGAQ